MASGLITGEALMGILVAIPIVILKQWDIEMPLTVPLFGFLRQKGIEIPLWDLFGGTVGVILLAFVVFWLYRTAVKGK